MEAKVLLVLFIAGLLAFTYADDDDSNGSDSGSTSQGSFGDSFEEKDEDCDRMVDGSDDNDGKCDLTDGLEEVSQEVECTEEERTIIVDWIAVLKGLLSVKKTIEERLVIALSCIQKFQTEHPTIYELIQYSNVSSFGYLASFTSVIQYRQTLQVEGLVTLDDDNNCPLFDALFNCTEGSYEQESAVNALINETLIDICGNYSISVKERYVLIYQALSQFFSINADWQYTFFQYQIQGFGSFQQFFEVTRTYYQSSQVDTIFEFESNVEECQFMISFQSQLTLIFNDASIDATLKASLKELYDLCKQDLPSGASGKARLAILIKLARKFIGMYGVKFAKLFYGMSIEGFGNFFELIQCVVVRNPKPIVTLAPPASSSPKPTCGCTCQPVTFLP